MPNPARPTETAHTPCTPETAPLRRSLATVRCGHRSGALLATLLVTLLLANGCGLSVRAGAPAYKTSVVTAYRLNVRSAPSVHASILEVLQRGDVVEILSRRGDWIEVRTPSRYLGWAYGAYLSGFDIPTPAPSAPERREAPGDHPPDTSTPPPASTTQPDAATTL